MAIESTGSRVFGDITIASGGTTSSAFDIGNQLVCAFLFPAMTSTSVTLYGSTTLNGTYVPIADSADSNLTITTSGTSKIRYINPQYLAGVRFIKLEAGSAEASARTIYVLGHD